MEWILGELTQMGQEHGLVLFTLSLLAVFMWGLRWIEGEG